MAAPKPEFTDSFVVQTGNYGDFVRLCRQNVIKYCSNVTGIAQPVLPQEQPIPERWFHVLLRTQASSLTLAVRMDNLYLVGFRTPAGVWWEFNNEQGKHLITGARWLGFGGRYQDLIGQKALETVTLGRFQMTEAVNVLAKHPGGTPAAVAEELQPQGGVLVSAEGGVQQADPSAEAKSKLAKLVIMICEGLRFLTVSGTVDKEFENPAATVTQMQGKQVNKWDRISAAVFKWAQDPTAEFPDLEEVGVKDRNDAARIVALVKFQKAN